MNNDVLNDNFMILNDKNIGISKIELDKSDLIIIDKSCRYCLHVCAQYNWRDINSIKVGEKKKIDLNEYCISENNESALIWPSKCNVKKISDDSLCFYLKFENLSNTIHYMNKRNCFDIKPDSLDVKVLIDYRDAIDGSIVYEF